VNQPDRTVASKRRTPSAAVMVVGIALVIAAVQMVLIWMFAWPSSRAQPHAVPIALAAPPEVAGQIAQGLEQAMLGAFAVTQVQGDDAARQAVLDNTHYGAISIAATGATVYTASGASPAIASSLAAGVPAALARANPQLPVAVEDLVPNPTDDPHGVVPATGLIPILITSIVAGALLALLLRGPWLKLSALVLYSVSAGLLAALTMQTILGGLGGSWIANAATLALLCFAISAATAGTVGVIGVAGLPIVFVVVFFFGMAFSGATTAWQFIPTPWGEVAQYLPAGAGNRAIRAVAFFDGAGGTVSLLVLAGWGLVGTGLLFVRRRASAMFGAGEVPLRS
jgi:hypothetical protein